MSNPFDDLKDGDDGLEEGDDSAGGDDIADSDDPDDGGADTVAPTAATDTGTAIEGEPEATADSTPTSGESSPSPAAGTAPSSENEHESGPASDSDSASPPSEPSPETGTPDESDEETVSPAETGPAFEYSEVKQKPFYARTETVNDFENAIRTTIVPKLAEAEVIDEETREIHDAVLRLAAERPERVAELVLEERRRSGSQ